MRTTIDNINETRKVIIVTIPVATIKEEAENLFKTFSKKVKIPGFRPGKAPVEMLKTKYSRELTGELSEKIVSAAYKHLVDNSGLNIYSVVKVDIDGNTVSEDNDAVITFTVDVKPSFELPEYRGIEVNLPTIEVKENEIDEAIDGLRNQRKEYNVKDASAEKGDYVKVSYEGKIEGRPIAEILPSKPMYSTQKSTWEEAGAEGVPGVSAVIEGVVGMKAGDQKTVTMHFPEDFEPQELAGKVATYDISIEEVRSQDLPSDEALLKSMQLETMDQLRQQIQRDLSADKGHASKGKARELIVKYLLDHTAFATPESAITDEADSLLRSYMTRMLNLGATQDQFEEQKDQLIAEAQKAATERAKLNIILEAIAKKENIEANNQDLNLRVMHEAYTAGVKPQQFIKQLQKDRRLANEIRQGALFNKVLDFLHKVSKVGFMDDTK